MWAVFSVPKELVSIQPRRDRQPRRRSACCLLSGPSSQGCTAPQRFGGQERENGCDAIGGAVSTVVLLKRQIAPGLRTIQTVPARVHARQRSWPHCLVKVPRFINGGTAKPRKRNDVECVRGLEDCVGPVGLRRGAIANQMTAISRK